MTTTRRFAAILAADVVGYSRLMGDHSVRLTSIPAGRFAQTAVICRRLGERVKSTEAV